MNEAGPSIPVQVCCSYIFSFYGFSFLIIMFSSTVVMSSVFSRSRCINVCCQSSLEICCRVLFGEMGHIFNFKIVT